MNLRQIECFWTAGALGSVSRASEELFISQPSVSKHIAALEKDLQIKLVERDGRNIKLTADGEKLHAYCGEVLKSVERLECESAAMRLQSKREQITLCGIPPMYEYGIINFVGTFKSKYPSIAVNIVERDEVDIPLQLSLDSCDVAFCSSLSIDQSLFQFCPLQKESLVVVFSPEHPHAHRESVSISDLQDSHLIFPTKSSGLYDLCYQTCTDAGFTPNIVMEISAPRSADIIIAQNPNNCFLTMNTLERMRPHNWSIVPVEDSPILQMGLVWKKRPIRKDSLHQFINFLTGS